MDLFWMMLPKCVPEHMPGYEKEMDGVGSELIT